MYSLPPNRSIDWSVAGVWYNSSDTTKPWLGTQGIPSSTTVPNSTSVVINTTDSGNAYYCDPSGSVDCTTKLQAAVTACPAGQAVYIPAGTYRISGAISIKSRTVVRGAGGGVTTIKQYANNVSHFTMSGSSGVSTGIDITSGYTKGSSQVVVASGTWAVGDLVLVNQLNHNQNNTPPDNAPTAYGFSYCNYCTPYMYNGTDPIRSMGEMAIVTEVNGSTLILNHPLLYNYESAYNPHIHRDTTLSGARYNCGVESLTLTQDTAIGSGSLSNPIKLISSIYCWVKDVEFVGIWRDMIVPNMYNYGIEVRRCCFRNARAYHSAEGGGFKPFGWPTHCLITNNIFWDIHVPVEFQVGGAGNVVSYNFSDYCDDGEPSQLCWTFGNHGTHCYMNLYEGNVTAMIHIDNYWGSHSHNVIFRNWFVSQNNNRPLQNQGRGCIKYNETNYYMSCIGNVLGYPGMSGAYKEVANLSSHSLVVLWDVGRDFNRTGAVTDPQCAETDIRHGNYDYVSLATEWESGEDTSLPTSMYLSSKPSWFGTFNWPPIGPDVSGYKTDIPAQHRWAQYQSTGNPTSLFTDVDVPITGFTNNDKGTLIISNNEVSKLYVDTPKKRAVIGTSVVYSVHAWPWEDFTGNITLDISGLPTGATDSYSVNPITYNGSSLVTVTTTGVAAGNYDMFITGTSTGGDVASVRILLDIVASADADIKIPFKHLRAKKGDSAVFTVQADSLPGFTQNIDLSVSGVPAGATATFGTDPLAYNGKTTLTINTGSAAVGSYELTVTGEGPV